MIEDDNLLGKFHLAEIMPAPRGLPQAMQINSLFDDIDFSCC